MLSLSIQLSNQLDKGDKDMLDVKQLMELLCLGYNKKAFVPILESDIVAYMYHLWITRFGEVHNVHLDTRLCQKLDSKFDFVIGDVDRNHEKPCIGKPKLVAEVKAFPYGFTDQQHRVHYYHVINKDLPKLQTLADPPDSRYMILFDEDDYLRGFDKATQSSRLERLTNHRNELDTQIVMVHLKKTEKGLEPKII